MRRRLQGRHGLQTLGHPALPSGRMNFGELPTGEVRRTPEPTSQNSSGGVGLGAGKRPITPIRPVTITIDRLNKPHRPTVPPPVTPRMVPVTTTQQRTSDSDRPANGGDPVCPGQE